MWNYFSRPNPEKWFRWILILVLGGLFLLGDYVFFYRIIRHLDNLPLQVGEELIVQLLNVVFLTLFAMILFSSLITSLIIFYISSDLDFLHSLPMRPGPVVTLRLFQNFIQSAWMVTLFSVPIFVAYGYYFHVDEGYYVYLGVSFLPFVVLPCVLGSMIIMLLMRYFPARKMHQALSLLGLVFLVGLVVYLRFLSPEKFVGKEVSDEMIMAFVASLRAPDYPFLPSSWITAGLTQWVDGQILEAWKRFSWLAAAAGGGLGVFTWVSRKIYFEGWRQMQEVRGAPVRKNNSSIHKVSVWDRLPLSPAGRALLLKDIKTFFRDPGQWSQLFILLALVVVYIFNIMNLPIHDPMYTLAFKNVISVLNIGLVGFVLAALISRFVFASTSMEGKKMWTIYTAPVKMEKFLAQKFIMYFPPLLVIAEFLVIVSNYLFRVDSYFMMISVMGVFFITFGLVGLGVGLGALYPTFQYENISEVSTSTGGILFMIESMIFIGLVLVLGARPMYVHFNEKFLARQVGGIEVPVCYGLIVILALAVALVPLRRGLRNLREMDI